MTRRKISWLPVSLCFSLLIFSGSSAFAGGNQALQFGASVSISGLATQGVGLSVAAEGRQLSGGVKTQRLSLKVNPADCSLESAEGGVSLQIKDAVGTGAPGQPELPLVVKRIVLPANSDVTGVSVIGGTYLPILNRLAIKAVAQPKALNSSSRGGEGEGVGRPARDEKAYSQNSYFPGNLVSFFAAPSSTETVVYLRFNPVQYIPGQESAILVSSLDVEVKYNPGPPSLGSGIGPGSLIICPARYLRAANALASLHLTKFNLTPLVVTTEYINSLGYGAPGVPALIPYPDVFCPQSGFSVETLPGRATVAAGGYNGDMARKIVSYIQESRSGSDNGWASFPELQYVVILGNALDVPPSYYVYNIPEGYSYMGRDSWIPTDYFYGLASYGSIVPNFGMGRISVMNVPYAENLTVSSITGSGPYIVTVSGAAWTTDQWVSYNIQLQSATYSDANTYPVILSNTANTLTVDIDPSGAGISLVSPSDVIKIVAGADYLVAKESKWFDAAFTDGTLYTPNTFPRDHDHWFYNVSLAGGAPFETWLYWGELDSLSVINMVDTDYDNLSLFNNIRTKKYFATDKKDYYRSTAEWDEAFCRTDVLPLLTGGAENGFVYIITHGSGKSIAFDLETFGVPYYHYPSEEIDTGDLLDSSLAVPSPFNLPILLSAGCMNGDFDELIWSSGGGIGPSFGEAALLSRAGSIAYLGGARSNFIGMSFSFDKGNLSYNTTLMPELLRNVFVEYHRQGNTLGTISTKAKIDYLGSYYGTSGWTAYNWRTLFQNTLLGDPALFIPVRTAAGSLAENILTDTFTALSPRTRTPSYDDYSLPVYEVSRGGTRSISTSFTGNTSLVGGLELKLIDPRWRESEDKRTGSSGDYSFSFADSEGTAGEEVGVTFGGPSIYFLRVATTDPNTGLYTKEKRIYYEGVNEFVPQGKILLVADDQQDRFRFSTYPSKDTDCEEWYERALQANNYHRLDTNGYFVWHNDNSDGSNAAGSASTSGDFGTQNQGRYGEITPDALNAYKSATKAVIYFTGDDSTTTLFPQDQTYVDSYLSTGGRLFITGQDIGYDLVQYGGGPTFYQDDLYATYRQDNVMLYELDGVSGNPITDGLFDVNINPTYAGTGARNQHYPSEIDPLTGAEPILFYRPGSGPGYAIGTSCAGLSVYDGTKALVYLPFGFEGIQTFDEASRGRKQIMGSIMNWLFNPTQTTVFSATAGDAEVNLSWRTPNAANFKGTQIVFKTGSYPVSQTDGTVIVQQDGVKNTFYSFLHTPLVNGTTYYYAAYWYSTTAGYTLIGQASATPEEGEAITYSVSGTVRDSDSNLMDGVTLTLQSGGNSPLSTTTNSSGVFTFSDVPGGNYILTASENNWVFEPGQRSFVLSGNRTGEDFTGYEAYGVSGTITREVGGAPLAGVLVELQYWDGADTQIVSQDTTDVSGDYTVWGRGDVSPGRQYTVVPKLAGWKFTPTGISVSIIASGVSGQDFTAKEAKYLISGTITHGAGTDLSGVLLTLSGTGFSDSKTTSDTGFYQFVDIPAGAYTLTPQKTGWTFQPVQVSISALDDDLANQDFSAYLDITFTTAPSGSPNPVTKGTNTVQCTTAAGTILSSTITYSWTATDGYFQNTGLTTSSLQNPVWVADVAMSPFEEYKLVRIQVTVSCTDGLSKTAYYFQRVNPVAEPVDSSAGGGGAAGPLAVGISALLGWWKRRKKRLSS